jgi:exosortase/archaeosortase family protein
VAIVVKGPWLDKVVIVLSAAPVAVACNVLRITATAILKETVTDGGRAATEFYHTWAGLFMMPLALVMIWAIMKVWSLLFVEAPAPKPVSSTVLGLGLVPSAPKSPTATANAIRKKNGPVRI